MNEHHYSRIDAGQPKTQYPKETTYTCVKRPLRNFPEERRDEIAQDVLHRYQQGEQVSVMAAEYELSDVTLYALLLRDHEEEWKDIQTARALARLERSQQGLDDAGNPLNLARAREQLRGAQWELERLLARLYAQKQEVTHNIQQPILNITVIQMAAQALQAPVDNSVVAEQLPQRTTPDNIPKLT